MHDRGRGLVLLRRRDARWRLLGRRSVDIGHGLSRECLLPEASLLLLGSLALPKLLAELSLLLLVAPIFLFGLSSLIIVEGVALIIEGSVATSELDLEQILEVAVGSVGVEESHYIVNEYVPESKVKEHAGLSTLLAPSSWLGTWRPLCFERGSPPEVEEDHRELHEAQNEVQDARTEVGSRVCRVYDP